MDKNNKIVLKNRLHDVLDNLNSVINDLKRYNEYAIDNNINTQVWYNVKADISGSEIKIIEARLKDFTEILDVMRKSLVNYNRKLG